MLDLANSYIQGRTLASQERAQQMQSILALREMQLRQQLARDEFANRLTLQNRDFLGRGGLLSQEHKNDLALQDAQYRSQLGLQNDQQAYTTGRDATLQRYAEDSAGNQHQRQLELQRLGHTNEMEAIGERGRQALLGIGAQGDIQYGLMGQQRVYSLQDREEHARAIAEWNRAFQSYIRGGPFQSYNEAAARLGSLGGPGEFVLSEPGRIARDVGRRAIQGYRVGEDASTRYGLPLPEDFYRRPRTYGPIQHARPSSSTWFDFLNGNFPSPPTP